MYRVLIRPLLFRMDAETAHHLALVALRVLQMLAPLRALVARVCRPRDPALAVRVLGVDFPSPVGLAAGFDKDARVYEALGALGFGFVEVGTVTASAQPGNDRPRMFRLPVDGALVNRLGFNNRGAAAARERLVRPRRTIVGVNIGKTKAVAESDAVADYVRGAELLGPLASYFVVNVSSPNTPGLRDLQSVERLRPLLAAVRDTLDRAVPARRVPLLVKIAPDLSDEDVDAIGDLALALGLEGIVATNTTIRRDGLQTPPERVAVLGAGGLSGRPLAARSLEVLRRLRARVGDRLVLVASGGIDDVDAAWARIRAGASLVQIYTGLVYEGPLFARRLARGLAVRARAEGFARVADAIGADAKPDAPTAAGAAAPAVSEARAR